MELGNFDDQVFKAVIAYAREQNGRLAGKIIHSLRRARAVGAYNECRHRTRWDEFSHEWQHGPHGVLRTAWEWDIQPHLENQASELSETEQLLLSAAAMWEFDDLHNHDELGICPDLIQRGIMRALVEQAMARDLSRFDPR